MNRNGGVLSLEVFGGFPLQNYIPAFVGGSPPLAEVIEKVYDAIKNIQKLQLHYALGKSLVMFTIQTFHFNLCMFLYVSHLFDPLI